MAKKKNENEKPDANGSADVAKLQERIAVLEAELGTTKGELDSVSVELETYKKRLESCEEDLEEAIADKKQIEKQLEGAYADNEDLLKSVRELEGKLEAAPSDEELEANNQVKDGKVKVKVRSNVRYNGKKYGPSHDTSIFWVKKEDLHQFKAVEVPLTADDK